MNKMGLFSREDAIKILEESPQLINEVIKKAFQDSKVVRKLAKDLAGELADAIEDEPRLKEKLLAVARKSEDFKNEILRELINKLN